MTAKVFKQEDSDEQSPVPPITDEELRRHVVSTYRAVQEIKTVLVGDSYGTKGVIPRLSTVETTVTEHAKVVPSIPSLIERVERHERQFIIWGAYITAAVTGIGIFAKLFNLL